MRLHSLSSVPGTAPEGLLVVGCGDVGLRVLRQLGGRLRTVVLTTSPGRVPTLRAAGAVPVVGDLNAPATLARLAGLCRRVLYLAPPDPARDGDPRCVALCRALARGAPPAVLVYVSTTGVYGDCGGAWLDETRPLAPATARARRRVAAEAAVRDFGRATGARVTVLRAPGIYALDREGGTPLARLERGTPVLAADDDVHTQHIHADDLARACIAALWRGRPQRAVNAVDASDLKMGEYFDLAADRAGLPRPPRVSRVQAAVVLSPAQLSFLGESRRIANRRLVRELRVRLAYPTVREGLAGLAERRSAGEGGGPVPAPGDRSAAAR